jgi:hydrogenase nickel incorporation protein HypA/HybF
MHELPILQSIVGVVLKHGEEAGATRVLAVDLEVGELRDLDEECMQRYFDFVSEGTAAAGATLRIRRASVLFSCRSCGSAFPLESGPGEAAACPACSSTEVELTGGNELRIESIDVI